MECYTDMGKYNRCAFFEECSWVLLMCESAKSAEQIDFKGYEARNYFSLWTQSLILNTSFPTHVETPMNRNTTKYNILHFLKHMKMSNFANYMSWTIIFGNVYWIMIYWVWEGDFCNWDTYVTDFQRL